MSQSVPGGYKYTRVVFKIVSVLSKIKMSSKSKTTVKGFIYSVEETKTIKDGDKTKQQFKISWCQVVKSARGGYKILQIPTDKKQNQTYTHIKIHDLGSNLPLGKC